MSNQDFYQNEATLKDYLQFRHSSESPNESIEKPAFLELLGDVQNKHILDLGCGDARFAHELFQKGCASYTGIEPSEIMLKNARENLAGTNSKLEQSTIEDWRYPEQQFDLVISRLVFHYVEDLDTTFKNIHKTLKPDGRLVFSMVHPVMTCCDKAREDNAKRSSWIVDDYFTKGARRVRIRNDFVTQYHRTLESILLSLQGAGFRLEGLREGCPRQENFEDKDLFERRLRIPLFLIISAHKLH